MKLAALLFASMAATAAAHPSSVVCNPDDTATTMRIGGVMMSQTVAAAPAGGATLTVTPARIANGTFYIHIDNIPDTDFFAIRAAGSAGTLSSTDGAMNNTDSCPGQAFLPVPADPSTPLPTKADLKYQAPAGFDGTPVFNLVYGSPAGLSLVTNAGQKMTRPQRPRGKYLKGTTSN